MSSPKKLNDECVQILKALGALEFFNFLEGLRHSQKFFSLEWLGIGSVKSVFCASFDDMQEILANDKRQVFLDHVRLMEKPDDKIGVLFNACFGGFGLSKQVLEAAREQGVDISNHLFSDDIRSDQRLVQIVLASENPGRSRGSKPKVAYRAAGMQPYLHIDEYDGAESVQYDWRQLYLDLADNLDAFNSLESLKRHMQNVKQCEKTDRS